MLRQACEQCVSDAKSREHEWKTLVLPMTLERNYDYLSFSPHFAEGGLEIWNTLLGTSLLGSDRTGVASR